MAILGREFIAVPDDRKRQIVFKWPDHNIRKMTKAIVDADEMALFVNTGQVVATMGPGRHQIDAQEIPGLGAIIDWATGGNAYRAELYFVGTREYAGFTFGGRIDDVQDPQTGMIVTLRVFGDYSLKVQDPSALVTNLVGTVDVTDNNQISGWVSDQLLKVMRTHVTTQIVRNGWPILGLSAYTPDIEKEVILAGNEQLSTYGVSIIRMGNFDVNLSDSDEATLKNLAKDTAYSRLAGSFNQYAAGEMALGAGEGMAKGGAATGGAFLGAGLGIGGQAAAPAQPGSPPPAAPGFAGGGGGYVGPGAGPGGSQSGAPASATVACPNCHSANPAGNKFCSSCGTTLAPPTVTCANCQSVNLAGAKFCANCGQALASSSVLCGSCGTEQPTGARFCASCGAGIPPEVSPEGSHTPAERHDQGDVDGPADPPASS
ncbi:MAG: SPFH domain-containing protein [Actinomycetota bacterium]|nr:SPFH domain-containing protein [Actinomycetota bacterium]